MPGLDLARQDDVVDAEFISLGSVASVDRAIALPPAQLAPAMPIDDLTMLSREANIAATPTSGGPMFWAGGFVVAFAAFWVAGGYTLFDVSSAPAASDATGLRIASVISRVDRSGEKPILLVDGKAVNDGVDAVAMPSLQIEVVTTGGGSARYKLGTAGRSLDGGGIFDFSSRLDLPKDGVKTVFVTFAQ